MSDFLTLTTPAAEKVAALLADCGEEQLAFRTKIIGGGCQGMQYVFELHEAQEDDWLMAVKVGDQSFNVVMDPISGQYLQGATIDYETSLTGEQFVIHNPNAQTTCSCGASFTDE